MSRTVDRVYLESMVPFMVFVQRLITPNPPLNRKSLPYPIYNAGIDPDAHVRVFCKAIQANGENNDVNIITLFCFTFRNTISKWGENFMKARPICKFEKLKATFCK